MKKESVNTLAFVSGFAFTMIVIIGASVFLGIWVDRWINTSPLFTIIFSVFGVFAGVYNLIRNVSKLEDRNGK
jgi:F0F1-type ATP synthase assembly protein I